MQLAGKNIPQIEIWIVLRDHVLYITNRTPNSLLHIKKVLTNICGTVKHFKRLVLEQLHQKNLQVESIL